MTPPVPPRRKALRRKAPTLAVERRCWQDGKEFVVGIDEVGRGAWAGPLSVGVAMVPRDRRVYKVRDSKMLTEVEREAMYARVAAWCDAWAVGHASHEECDELGMADAQRLAASRALEQLDFEPDHVLLDGNWDFIERGTTEKIVRGDQTSLSISAASILAKVTRDRIMRTLAEHYPYYAFDANKGYPGPRHKAALQHWGPSAIHRRSWAFMDGLPWTGLRRYVRPDPQGTLFDVAS
jgi:ribonuclease HII